MRNKKPTIRIPVDNDYSIVIDEYNWAVMRVKINNTEGSENYGKPYEVAETFNHNLSGALEDIVKSKVRAGKADIHSLKAYLAWHESTLHTVADRVLQRKEELQEAMELNKVM